MVIKAGIFRQDMHRAGVTEKHHGNIMTWYPARLAKQVAGHPRVRLSISNTAKASSPCADATTEAGRVLYSVHFAISCTLLSRALQRTWHSEPIALRLCRRHLCDCALLCYTPISLYASLYAPHHHTTTSDGVCGRGADTMACAEHVLNMCCGMC